MTRKSKRELERAVERLQNNGNGTATSYTPLRNVYSEDVVQCIHSVARDVMRIIHRNPDTDVNASEPEATTHYLELVREQYGIDEDRDEAVRVMLNKVATGNPHSYPTNPHDVFLNAVLSIPSHILVEDKNVSFEKLVADGREDRAKQLLVGRVYRCLAALGHCETGEHQKVST